MCLALEGKIVELKEKGKKAVVEFSNRQQKEYLNVIKAGKGEKVLVQQGMVVEKMEETE